MTRTVRLEEKLKTWCSLDADVDEAVVVVVDGAVCDVVALENVVEIDGVLVIVVVEPGKTLGRRKLLLW